MAAELRALLARPPERDATAPLDGIRALMFTWVFHLHLWPMLYLHAPEDDVVAFMRRETPFSELVWRGSVAVDAFNLMGAYLAALPLLQRLKRDPTAPPSWLSTREYILDRLQRLAPLFYAFTLLCLLLNAVVAPIMNATNAWRNFVFVANFFPFETTFMQHTWSLSLEMQLHLALPALVYALHARAAQPARAFRLVATALVACALVTTASCAAVHALSPTGLEFPPQINGLDWEHRSFAPAVSLYYRLVYLPVWTRCGPFFVGLALAFARAHPPAGARDDAPAPWLSCSTPRVVGALALLALSLAPKQTSHPGDRLYSPWLATLHLSVFRLAFALALGVLLYWALEARKAPRAFPAALRAVSDALSLRVWYPVAAVSYEAFLLHVLVLGGLLLGARPATPGVPLSDWTALRVGVPAYALTLLASALVLVFFERPLLARLRRRAKSA